MTATMGKKLTEGYYCPHCNICTWIQCSDFVEHVKTAHDKPMTKAEANRSCRTPHNHLYTTYCGNCGDLCMSEEGVEGSWCVSCLLEVYGVTSNEDRNKPRRRRSPKADEVAVTRKRSAPPKKRKRTRITRPPMADPLEGEGLNLWE